MMNGNRRQGGGLRTAAAFTLGAAAGSIVALLYAPASGEVTRRRIAQRARQLRRTAARRIGQTGRVLTVQAARVRDAAGEWITEHMPQGNGKQVRRPVRHAH